MPTGPISAAQSILSRTGDAYTDSAFAVAPTVIRAMPGSTACAALVAAAAARAGSPSIASVDSRALAIPRVPLHLLGTERRTADSAGFPRGFLGNPVVMGAAGAPVAPFVALPDNDTLGIIASYVSQDDQLAMRNVDASVRTVVDPMIHALKLSAREALAALSGPNALRNLREIHLTDCTDEDLIDLAGMLAKLPKIDFELIITSNPFSNHVSVAGIKPLTALRLSGLTLSNIPVPVEMSRALALSVSPLSINLPYLFEEASDVFDISQLPRLRSLLVGRQELMPETIDALRSHPALKKLHIKTLSGADVHTLAMSPHLRSLSIGRIRDGEAEALRALADNRVLTSLTVSVEDASALVALSRNVTLQALSISVPALPATLISSLAMMPALEDLDISAHGMQAEPISVDDIRVLSEKPLKSLSFSKFQLEGAACLILATAQTASLHVHLGTPFNSAEFAALSRNRTITSLYMQPGRGTLDNADDVLALVTNGPPQLESMHIRVVSATPDIATTAIQMAWRESGRQMSKLELDVWPT